MSVYDEPVRLCRYCSTQGVCEACGTDHDRLNSGAVAFSLHPTLAEVQAAMDDDARRGAQDVERWRRHMAAMALIALEESRVHPPVPKGVWR